jgi:hypothetical protein
MKNFEHIHPMASILLPIQHFRVVHKQLRARFGRQSKVANECREQLQEHLVFDRELLSYRQTAEWGMRGLQGSFGWLQIPLVIGRDAERGDLLEICCRLNNLRAELVGINQIRNVYMPLWRETRAEEEVWINFENMLFGDQHRSDRVARFHNVAIYE